MKYHGPKDMETKQFYIVDFSINEEEKVLTVITADGRELRYQFNEENMEKLEAAYQAQTDTAVEKIPTYKFNRAKSRAISATVGVVGAIGVGAAINTFHTDAMTTIAIGAGVVAVVDTLLYSTLGRPTSKLLEEAIHFKMLKKHGDSVVTYMRESENAYAGFSDARKQELVGMISQGMDPASILEIDGIGLTTTEIQRLNENKRFEKQYQFTPIPTKKAK